MAKIDEVKEILNTLRIAMSIIVGIIVMLVGKLFSKFEAGEFDYVFWIVVIVTIIIFFIEGFVVFQISEKTKQIKDL